MKSFKKIAILSAIFVAILGFFVWKYYQEKQEKEEPIQSNKEIFISELLDNLNGYENNMLYEDMSKVDGPIVDEIFKTLIDKQQITRENLLEIFAKCNS